MIIGISGHQALDPGTSSWVMASLHFEVGKLPASTGMTSLAAGTDQIFAQVVLAHGWELYVVLPCHLYDSTFTSLEDIRSFRELYRKATRCETLDFDEPNEDAFLAAGKRVVEMSDLMIFVWNALPAKGRGGTGDIVQYAITRSIPFIHLNPVERTTKRSAS